MLESKNARRIKNILDGNITSGVSVGVGYEKKEIIHDEGDIWEENGKEFILKNGIKRSYSKLSNIRKKFILPFTCPKCGKTMKETIQNKKIYDKFGYCFDCLIEQDTKNIIDGSFQQKEKKFIKENQVAYIGDLKQKIVDFIDKIDSKHFITEFGDVEDWTKGQDKEELKKQLDEGFNKFVDIVNKE